MNLLMRSDANEWMHYKTCRACQISKHFPNSWEASSDVITFCLHARWSKTSGYECLHLTKTLSLCRPSSPNCIWMYCTSTLNDYEYTAAKTIWRTSWQVFGTVSLEFKSGWSQLNSSRPQQISTAEMSQNISFSLFLSRNCSWKLNTRTT